MTRRLLFLSLLALSLLFANSSLSEARKRRSKKAMPAAAVDPIEQMEARGGGDRSAAPRDRKAESASSAKATDNLGAACSDENRCFGSYEGHAIICVRQHEGDSVGFCKLTGARFLGEECWDMRECASKDRDGVTALSCQPDLTKSRTRTGALLPGHLIPKTCQPAQ